MQNQVHVINFNESHVKERLKLVDLYCLNPFAPVSLEVHGQCWSQIASDKQFATIYLIILLGKLVLIEQQASNEQNINDNIRWEKIGADQVIFITGKIQYFFR